MYYVVGIVLRACCRQTLLSPLCPCVLQVDIVVIDIPWHAEQLLESDISSLDVSMDNDSDMDHRATKEDTLSSDQKAPGSPCQAHQHQ